MSPTAKTAVLLTGDSTELGEKLALKAQPDHYFRADVLKVAHHGSSDSTFEKSFSMRCPPQSLSSASVAETITGTRIRRLLDRLTERGITIYRTDEDGTITLLLDGTSVTVVK